MKFRVTCDLFNLKSNPCLYTKIVSRSLVLVVFAILTAVKVNADEIRLWCNAMTGAERYTTKTIAPAGYKPCGDLSMKAYCSAFGEKYIGRPGTEPYGYLDCSRGPRIILGEQIVDSKVLVPQSRKQSESAFNLAAAKIPLATNASTLYNGNPTLIKSNQSASNHTHIANHKKAAQKIQTSLYLENEAEQQNLPIESQFNLLPNKIERGMIEQIFSGYLGYLAKLDELANDIP